MPVIQIQNVTPAQLLQLAAGLPAGMVEVHAAVDFRRAVCSLTGKAFPTVAIHHLKRTQRLVGAPGAGYTNSKRDTGHRGVRLRAGGDWCVVRLLYQ